VTLQFHNVEEQPKYMLKEEFGKVTKFTKFTTNDMKQMFGKTMEFLKYIGFTDDMLQEYFELYQSGDI
jgi:hypothetical protein